MPITREAYRQYLVQKGQNPDEYDLDTLVEEYNYRESQKAAPTPTPAVAPQEQITGGEAFKRLGKRSLIPSLGAAASGAASAQYLPFSHIAPPYSEIIAGGIGAVAGGLLTGEAQEKALELYQGEEQYKKGLEAIEAARQQQPTFSFLGEAAPGLLTARPSIKNIKEIARGVSNLGTGGFNPAARQALITGAAQAGAGGAIEAGMEAAQGQEMDPMRIGGQALAGGLLTKPWLLGKNRLFGYQAHPEAQPGQTTEPTPEVQKPLLNTEFIGPRPLERPFGMSPREFEAKGPTMYKEQQEQLGRQDRRTEGITPTTEIPVLKPGYPVEPLLLSDQPVIDIPLETAAEKAARSVAPSERFGKPGFTQTKHQEESTLAQDIKDYLAKSGRSEQSNEDLQILAAELAKKRGVKRIVFDPTYTGAGEINLQTGVVKLGPKAGLDTLFHEGTHKLIQNIQEGQTSKHQAKTLKDAINALTSKGNADPEEVLTEAAGLRETKLGLDKLDKNNFERLKSYIQDVLVNLKTRFGLEATPEQVSNLLARWHFENASVANPTDPTAFVAGRIQKEQEESSLPSQPLHATQLKTKGILDLVPAIRIRGSLFKGEQGDTHGHVMAKASSFGMTLGDISRGQHGFMTPDGEFLTRDEASRKYNIRTSEQIRQQEESKLPKGNVPSRYTADYVDADTGVDKLNSALESMEGDDIYDKIPDIAEELEKQIHKSTVPGFDEVIPEVARQQGESKLQTDTPEFKRWFGDSKVVDKDGKPLVVYHGTSRPEFTKFNTKGYNSRGYTYGEGAYFTPEASRASEYSGIRSHDLDAIEQGTESRKFKELSEKPSRIYPTYVSIENPYIVNSDASLSDLGSKLYRENPTLYKQLATAVATHNNYTGIDGISPTEVANLHLRRQGYDGVIKKWGNGEIVEVVAFEPNQIKSATGNKGTFDPENPDIRMQEDSQLPTEKNFFKRLSSFTAPAYDRIALETKGTKLESSGDYATKTLHKLAGLKSTYEGKFENGVRDIMDKFNTTEQENVLDYMDAMDISDGQDNAGIELTPKEEQLENALRKYLVDVHDEQRKRKISILGREAKDNPNYIPSILSREAMQILTEHGVSEEAARLRNIWADYRVKQSAKQGKAESKEEALGVIKDYIRAINAQSETSQEFNAIRKAEGLGLPKELRDPNLISRLSRYGRRVSQDFAWFDSVQNDPIARKILFQRNQHGQLPSPTEEVKLPNGDEATELYNQKYVRDAVDLAKGRFTQVPDKVMKLSKVVTSAILGTGTGLRNMAALGAQASPYIETRDLGKMVEAVNKVVSDYSDVSKKAYLAGAYKNNINDIQFADNPDRIVTGLDRAANFLRKYQGADLLERISRVYSYTLGDILTTAQFQRALNKDNKAIDFLKKFGHTVEGGIEQYIGKTPSDIPAEVSSRIAKEFSDTLQGSYDGRELPLAAINSPYAPFLTLSRWSIGRMNHVRRDVLQPALSGNYLPLLKYTLGTVLTGAAIQQLNTLLSNKKDTNPTLKESLAANNTEEAAYSVVALMQLGSFAGIVGDLLKGATDLRHGQIPRGQFSFPLADFVGQTSEDLAAANQAIEQGAPTFGVSINLIEKTLRNVIQSYRYLSNNFTRKEDVERSQKFRDLQVYKKLVGEPTTPMSQHRANEFLNKANKDFKRETDLGTALGEQLPALIQQAVKDSKGDIEVLAAKLRSIKANSYQTVPNPMERPKLARGFMDFLDKTQGQGEGQRRFLDYNRQNLINRVKSRAVPSL